MKKIAALLGAVGFIGMAGSAGAIQYDYDWSFLGTTITANSGLNAAACGSSAAECQLVFASTGDTPVAALKARAYSSTSSTTDGGNFIGADINADSLTGIGIDNLTADSEPNRGTYVDNAGATDVLVLEAPTNNFAWESLLLGITTTEFNRDNGNAVDLQIHVGGSGADKNFTSLCFSGCTGTNVDLLTDGFTSLGSISSDATTPIAFGSNAVGRYLVVSGALGGDNDFFRVASVGGHTVPSPQTLPLLALGLAGMWCVMRRRVSA